MPRGKQDDNDARSNFTWVMYYWFYFILDKQKRLMDICLHRLYLVFYSFKILI